MFVTISMPLPIWNVYRSPLGNIWNVQGTPLGNIQNVKEHPWCPIWNCKACPFGNIRNVYEVPRVCHRAQMVFLRRPWNVY